VLEPLSGYLTLCEALWQRGTEVAEGWNFGPTDEDAKPVQWIVERMVEAWGNGARWEREADFHPHEARYLKLDISKAAEVLHWHPSWRLNETLGRIVDWHRAWLAGADMRVHCLQEIRDYTASRHRRHSADLPTSKIVL
jgi:CDP-glucose 4,6-dehydratase